MLFSTPKHRGATTTEKLRGAKVWVPTLGCLAACAPCPDQRPGWGWVREGSPLPAVGVRDFWTPMLNPAFWWLLRSLVGSRGRVYPNKQQACQGLNQFKNFNFSAVVAALRPWLLETTRSSADADNRRDAFITGQSRSTNIVPFHIGLLGIVSYCAIVTLSFWRTLFTIFDFKKCRDLEIGVRGHSTSLKVATFDRLCMVSY